jgi:small subunit ribosomal protein S4
MKIGPRYKVARRLGAPVFEKTQTQRYALSQARKEKSGKAFQRPKSDFGIQLLEKQKARYTYALPERQFSKYAKEALAKKDKRAVDRLFQDLELRADNVAYRAGLAPTRLAARQMVSHGHVCINGKRITIPSYKLKIGDVLTVRAGSMSKGLFNKLQERLESYTHPSWIKFDKDKRSVEVMSEPKYQATESLFDINAILEFYSR